MIFTLGIVVGALLMLGVILTSRHPTIQRTLNQILDKPIFPSQKAFIAGLSDEEQSFADSINKTKDTKLT